MWNKNMMGRLYYKTNEEKRHRELVRLLKDIITRARDSTMMDVGYDAGKIEELFKLEQVSVVLPLNDWQENDTRGLNHDRWFIVSLYIDKAKAWLEKQGLAVNK